MFFQESEAIVREHSDLLHVVELVDERLSAIFSPAPLRSADFSRAIGADGNQVLSVFELLEQKGVLYRTHMVECEHCQNLMPADAFRQALEDEDEFECTACSRSFPRRFEPIVVYRMSARALARPKPDVRNAEIGITSDALAGAENVFQRSGDMWVLRFQGKTIHMPEKRGLFYIARLLTDPNRDIPAVTLFAAAAGIDPRMAAGSSGEILDDEARTKYGKRYVEIQEEQEEARQDNDLGRMEKLQKEMDALATEIARATGLGGRRREQTDAEKIRKSVSMAVTRAIEDIESHHEPLAHHLTVSISSGRLFKYQPEQPIDWLL